jgi:hypothetical protein
MEIIRESLFQNVPAMTTVIRDYVVPDGVPLLIAEAGGAAAGSETCCVDVTWDPDGGDKHILMATHGDSRVSPIKKVIGDGVKKVRITMNNYTLQGATIGAWWVGELGE